MEGYEFAADILIRPVVEITVPQAVASALQAAVASGVPMGPLPLGRHLQKMLAEGSQDRSAAGGGVIRHMGILLQYDIRGTLHQPPGTEWPNLLIAEHGGAQNDAQRDLIKAIGINQGVMKLLSRACRRR